MKATTYLNAMERTKMRLDHDANDSLWPLGINHHEKYTRQYWRFREGLLHKLERLELCAMRLKDAQDDLQAAYSENHRLMGFK